MVCDLASRLASRGITPPAVDDIGRICGPDGPAKLKEDNGSEQVRGQMQRFLAAVLRGRTVPELREVCSLAGMQTCGAKADLVRRLAYQRVIEPLTPKQQVRNKFSETATISPERTAQPQRIQQSKEEFGLVKKVSRRRSVGVPPSVDVVHSDFAAQPKLDDSIKSHGQISDSNFQATKKRRRMSI